MTADSIVYLVLGAMAGGFISGLAGTGTALFALGFFLVVLDPKSAVAVVALLSILSGAQGLWVVRDTIWNRRDRLFRFLVPGLIGVPIGISILAYIDARTLKLTIAGLLILYGGYFGFRSALPRFDRSTPKTDATIAFTGGILGGAAALSGALPSIWCSMRPWPKAEVRAVLQPYNFAILGLTVLLLAWNGAYTREALLAFAIAVPAGLVAAQIGIAVFRRLTDDGFRRLLIVLCLALGVGILLRELI